VNVMLAPCTLLATHDTMLRPDIPKPPLANASDAARTLPNKSLKPTRRLPVEWLSFKSPTIEGLSTVSPACDLTLSFGGL
jgi:hypothetical protein